MQTSPPSLIISEVAGTIVVLGDRWLNTQDSYRLLFYGKNSWAYTRLGHITDRTADELVGLLGGGDVSITITVK